MLNDEKSKVLDTRVKQQIAKMYSTSGADDGNVKMLKAITDVVVTTAIITLQEYEKLNSEEK